MFRQADYPLAWESSIGQQHLGPPNYTHTLRRKINFGFASGQQLAQMERIGLAQQSLSGFSDPYDLIERLHPRTYGCQPTGTDGSGGNLERDGAGQQ